MLLIKQADDNNMDVVTNKYLFYFEEMFPRYYY